MVCKQLHKSLDVHRTFIEQSSVGACLDDVDTVPTNIFDAPSPPPSTHRASGETPAADELREQFQAPHVKPADSAATARFGDITPEDQVWVLANVVRHQAYNRNFKLIDRCKRQ